VTHRPFVCESSATPKVRRQIPDMGDMVARMDIPQQLRDTLAPPFDSSALIR
jgi:hypothetical protein